MYNEKVMDHFRKPRNVENFQVSNNCKEKAGDHRVDIYCANEDREICSKCAARYHEKCQNL